MRGRAFFLLSLVLAVFVVSCGGGQTVTPTPETVEGTIAEPTTPDLAKGNAEAGKAVYEEANPGCGTCHTFKAAGSDGDLGPNLDEVLSSEHGTPEHIYESIVNPDAEITEGFKAGVMPKTYGEELSDQQLADLVAFLRQGAEPS